MKALTMTEPASSAVGGFVLWKALTAAAAGGSVLAMVVVMIMTRPKTGYEWAVGLISTVVGSLGGGAYVAVKLGLTAVIQAGMSDSDLFFALLNIGSVMFACGLPAWALVRAAFNYMEKNKDKGIDQVVADAKAMLP